MAALLLALATLASSLHHTTPASRTLARYTSQAAAVTSQADTVFYLCISQTGAVMCDSQPAAWKLSEDSRALAYDSQAIARIRDSKTAAAQRLLLHAMAYERAAIDTASHALADSEAPATERASQLQAAWRLTFDAEPIVRYAYRAYWTVYRPHSQGA